MGSSGLSEKDVQAEDIEEVYGNQLNLSVFDLRDFHAYTLGLFFVLTLFFIIVIFCD